MSNEPYSDAVRRLFADPAHAGTLDGGVVVFKATQGIRIELSARPENGRIEALRFRVWGCPHLIGATEAFCDAFEGVSAGELVDFIGAPISVKLDIPIEKAGRILVLEDAVRSLGAMILEPGSTST